MENAGRGAAAYALELLGERRRVAVLAGPGNNGGDGFVIARHLLNAGREVTTYLAVAPSKIKGDAKVNYDILRSMGPRLEQITDKASLDGLASRLRHDGFVIDALLGTGVSREVDFHSRRLRKLQGLHEITRATNLSEPDLSRGLPFAIDSPGAHGRSVVQLAAHEETASQAGGLELLEFPTIPRTKPEAGVDTVQSKRLGLLVVGGKRQGDLSLAEFHGP